MQLFVHPYAVLAIYAKENGRGMEFGEEYNEPPPPPVADISSSAARSRGKPVLKLVE
jgi:stringent starvation protein B